MNTVGDRIRELRLSKGMTGEELGKIFNVTKSTISNRESNKREPDGETVVKLVQFFGVTADYLLGSTQDPSLTAKDERDIAERIAELNADLENQHNLMMHGEIMDEETRELLKASLAAAVLTSKIKAKEKQQKVVSG